MLEGHRAGDSPAFTISRASRSHSPLSRWGRQVIDLPYPEGYSATRLWSSPACKTLHTGCMTLSAAPDPGGIECVARALSPCFHRLEAGATLSGDHHAFNAWGSDKPRRFCHAPGGDRSVSPLTNPRRPIIVWPLSTQNGQSLYMEVCCSRQRNGTFTKADQDGLSLNDRARLPIAFPSRERKRAVVGPALALGARISGL